MSFITDHVRLIDAQLDLLQLTANFTPPSSPLLRSSSQGYDGSAEYDERHQLQRIASLQVVIRSLAAAVSSGPLSSWKIVSLLERANLSSGATTTTSSEQPPPYESYCNELEWLLVSKATLQTYGLILKLLVDEILPLANDIWYWDSIRSSYTYGALYYAQTSPIRLWAWSRDIYHDARERFESSDTSDGEPLQAQRVSVSAQWKRFWNLVQESARDRSLAGVQSKIMTPVTQARFEVLSKQHHLMELRELSASGLGVLMDSALDFDDDAGSMMTRSNDEWKTIVSKSITLMESVLRHATASDTGVSQFETLIFSKVEEATPVADEGDVQRPAHLATKLHLLHAIYMPQFSENMRNLKKEYGRPSRLTRYWIPGLALALSSSTLLKVLFSRKAKIITWIHDFGATSRDFWFNWVVEPIRKTIGTIRHDKESEIAIMSKDSLIGDRESLERMVVDFAVDNSGGNLSEAAIADIRAKTKTGDLTPVLLAYEKDLRRPFVGTIKGDLIRALLIQIQKTKVDVEVAIGGIDSLLKSQELVFAFVGLTPSILICLAVSRWLGGVVTGRSGRKRGKTQTRMVRVLRNIDRILTDSRIPSTEMLTYKDHGLLLCETHVLRQSGERLLPREVKREFLQDVGDLANLDTGIQNQRRIVKRIRWAYSRWLSS